MQSIHHYDEEDDDDDGDDDGDGDNDGDEQWEINQSFIQARPLQFHPQLQQVWLLVMIDTNADINTNKMIKIQTDRNADEMIKIEMSIDIMTMILLCI